MERHRLPPVVIDGARAQHLEVLRAVAIGRPLPRVVEDVGEARAVEVGLGYPVDLGRSGDAGQLEHGRQHVDGVGVLPAQPAPDGRRAAAGT